MHDPSWANQEPPLEFFKTEIGSGFFCFSLVIHWGRDLRWDGSYIEKSGRVRPTQQEWGEKDKAKKQGSDINSLFFFFSQGLHFHHSLICELSKYALNNYLLRGGETGYAICNWMRLSVTQVILSLGMRLFENVFDIILNNYLYPFSAKMEQENACGGVNHTTECGIPEEEPFPVLSNFKVMRTFSHPFSLSPFSLSFSLLAFF